MKQGIAKLKDEVSYVPHFELVNWSPRARIGAGAASVLAFAASRGFTGSLKDVTRFLALSLGLRALLNKDLTQVIGTVLSPTIQLRRQVKVRAPEHEVIQFWTRLENYPRFMSFVQSVTASEQGNLLWQVSAPGGIPMRWEAYIKSWWPNRTISWVSVPGSPVFNSGVVSVESIDEETCKVWVELTYALRAGALGHAFSRLMGFDPRERIDHDLSVMKTLIEEQWKQRQSADILPLTI